MAKKRSSRLTKTDINLLNFALGMFQGNPKYPQFTLQDAKAAGIRGPGYNSAQKLVRNKYLKKHVVQFYCITDLGKALLGYDKKGRKLL